MEKDLPYENDATRIAEQRRAKRDITLGPHPILDKLPTLYGKILKAHIGFVLGWLILTSIAPFTGEFVAGLLSPLADVVFFVHSHYVVPDYFTGARSATFYRSIVGETFFIGIVLGVLNSTVYMGRYWSRPWRLSQFLLEQVGTKASKFAAFVSLLILLPLLALTVFMMLAWYGLLPYVEDARPIALHQLALWAILASNAAVVSSLLFLWTLSTLAFCFKKSDILSTCSGS